MKKTIKRLLFGAVLAAPLAAWADPENLENDPAVPNWTEADGITNNWFGTRTALQDRGIEIFGGYTAEVWGNTTGGVKDGAVYTGLLDFGLELDLKKPSAGAEPPSAPHGSGSAAAMPRRIWWGIS